jgi:hypothetical protein
MAQSGTTWEIPIGDDAQYAVYIYDSADKVITTYSGAEPLTAKVWQGDDQTALAGVVSLDFTDPLTGLTTATISGIATASLAPQVLAVELDITVGSLILPYWQGFLALTPSAGLAAVPATYISYQDLMDAAGAWLPKLVSKTGQTSFLAERTTARSRFDKAVLARVRPAAFDMGSYLASGYSSGQLLSDLDDQYIKGLLAANSLIVSPDVKEANTYLALHLICEKQITWDEKDTFFTRSRYYFAKWDQVLASITAELDTNADGVGDLCINMGLISTR